MISRTITRMPPTAPWMVKATASVPTIDTRYTIVAIHLPLCIMLWSCLQGPIRNMVLYGVCV